MKRYLLICATAALLAVPALAFGRATTTVTVEPNPNSFTFEPKTVTKNVGAGADGLGHARRSKAVRVGQRYRGGRAAECQRGNGK